MKTKKELFYELKKREKVIDNLSDIRKKHKELLEYITKTNYIIFKFAQEVNHQFDIDNIVNNAKKILQEHFSPNSEIFIDKDMISTENPNSVRWVVTSGSRHIEDIKEVMDMKNIIFIPNTIKMENFIGETREDMIKELNQGFQPLYKKWFVERYNNKDKFNHFIIKCIDKQPIINKQSIKDIQQINNFDIELVNKVKKDIEEKIILCHKKRISSFAAIPLVKNNNTIGYFNIITKHGNRSLIEEQIPLLNTLANLTVIAIMNAERYHQEIYIDYRTGLPKRRLLFKYIEEAIRNNKEFSILITDLDNFKQYVDTFGHQAGQKAIDDFGYLAKGKLRKDAKIAVLGGDEYLIFLPDSNKEIASKIGEEIRESVSNYLFDNEVDDEKEVKDKENDVGHRENLKIKVSIGVSDFSDIKSGEIKEQIKEIIKKADDALFHAKQKGRDKVCVWDVSLPVTRDVKVER